MYRVHRTRTVQQGSSHTGSDQNTSGRPGSTAFSPNHEAGRIDDRMSDVDVQLPTSDPLMLVGQLTVAPGPDYRNHTCLERVRCLVPIAVGRGRGAGGGGLSSLGT